MNPAYSLLKRGAAIAGMRATGPHLVVLSSSLAASPIAQGPAVIDRLMSCQPPPKVLLTCTRSGACPLYLGPPCPEGECPHKPYDYTPAEFAHQIKSSLVAIPALFLFETGWVSGASICGRACCDRNFLEGEPAIRVLGRSVLAGGKSATIVGVVPPRFVVLGANYVEI